MIVKDTMSEDIPPQTKRNKESGKKFAYAQSMSPRKAGGRSRTPHKLNPPNEGAVSLTVNATPKYLSDGASITKGRSAPEQNDRNTLLLDRNVTGAGRVAR